MQGRQRVTRRDFVKRAGAVVGGAAAAGALQPAGSAAEPGGLRVPHVTLGRTGVSVSRLALGCSHFQLPELSVDDVGRVIHRALELGINYFDVAPNYGREGVGFSEEKMGPTVKKARDRMFLVTKVEEATYEGAWALMRQSMKRLQTDHLDLVHLHNFGHEPRFPDLDLLFSKRGALGALREAKKQGVVRFIGASGHLHPSRFHRALDTGEIDVLMNAVNLVARHVYDFEDKVWARARLMNLGLAAMKVLGGAGPNRQGFRFPTECREAAIRYALSVPGVHTAVIGMKTVEELEQNARTVAAWKPLSEQEQIELRRLGLELAARDGWWTLHGQPTT